MFKKIMIAGLGLLASFSVSATEVLFDGEFPLVWQSIVLVSGGPAWTSPGENQYLYPINPPPVYNYYQSNSNNSVLATGEIFFGLQRLIQPFLTGQLGIGLAGATDAQLSGVASVNGVSDVYTYNYKVDHGRVDLKGKLISNSFSPVQPYISGSIGVGFNNSHDYVTSSAFPVLFPAPWFSPSTVLAFSYTLGIGVQAMVAPNWQVGVGYEFADLGKSSLESQLVNYYQGLTLTHLYTNELLFSVGYVF